MLKSLSIKNYAIIDELSIDFESGFNVFTGETGAGKSIIVGALSFLLKGKSDTSIIKTGKDKAIIEGIFVVKDKALIDVLKEQDIEVDDEIIVKRVISRDNRNSIKINESNVTLSFLTDLFSKYVDIHSQKDNHFLFSRSNQLSLLDRFSNNENLLIEYREEFNNYKKLKNEYDDLVNNTYNEKEIEYYHFDLKELEDADLSLDEEAELEEKEKLFKSKEKYIEALNNAIALYDNNYGIKENLYNLYNTIDLDDDKISELSSNIQDIYYRLDENVDALKDMLESLTDGGIDIEYLQERLYLYSKLKRKHKTDTEGLLRIKDDLKQKISLFEDKDNVLNEKKKELETSFSKAKNLALKLHETRIAAGKALIHEVTKEANDLLLNNIVFKIGFNEIEFNEFGKDEVEFMVSLNKGEDIKPLRNVASGGEVSRLLLALKVVFAKLSNTDLLLLDEIDSGVSGKVALAVGEKISKISKAVQVLCITHLAPVAACADAHYQIYKEDDIASTHTNVKKLAKDEIINELAIISNTSTDPKALAAAKELYNNCQKIVHEN